MALITGCSTGIGRETARALNATGINLILCGRDVEKLELVIEELQAENKVGSLTAMRIDLSSMASVRAAAEKVLHLFDRLDLLVCNAGKSFPSRSPEQSLIHSYRCYHDARKQNEGWTGVSLCYQLFVALVCLKSRTYEICADIVIATYFAYSNLSCWLRQTWLDVQG